MGLPTLIDVAETVTLRAVFLALSSLLLWLGALILAALVVAIVYTILWPLNKFVSTITLGVVGSVPGAHTVEQFFTNLLGEAAAGVDSAAGNFWHALKRLVVQVGDEILGLAVLSGYIWWWAQTKLPTIIWHRFGSWVHAGTKAAEAEARQAERDAQATWKYAHSQVIRIDHRIDAIPGTIEGVLQPELKSARELAQEAEDLANNAWDWIKQNGAALTASGAFALVVAAFGTIGWDFLKCSAWRGLGSRLTCGMGQLLLDLLEGAIAVMVVEDICAITGAAIAVIESPEISDFLTSVTNDLDNLLTCQGMILAAPLTGPYFDPPPVQAPAALAA